MTPTTTLHDLLDGDLQPSGWRTIDQEAVDRFAAVTGDDQWIHVDPERAKASPLGSTIVHGYFTLALAPVLLDEIVDLTEFGTVVNYGIGRLRFPAPLPVASRVRLHASVTGVESVPGGTAVTLQLTFEREGGERPVCVAEVLYRVLREKPITKLATRAGPTFTFDEPRPSRRTRPGGLRAGRGHMAQAAGRRARRGPPPGFGA